MSGYVFRIREQHPQHWEHAKNEKYWEFKIPHMIAPGETCYFIVKKTALVGRGIAVSGRLDSPGGDHIWDDEERGDRAESAVLKQQQARRRRILDRARRSANEVENEVRARVDASLADFYGHAIKVVEEQRGELDALLIGRSGLRQEHAMVAREANTELGTLEVTELLEEKLIGHL